MNKKIPRIMPPNILGYEPANLSVHPPPQKKTCRKWFNFFCLGA